MDGSTSVTLAEGFRTLSARLFRTRDSDAALADLVQLAATVVPSCGWAGITRVSGRGGRYVTIAATAPVVRVVDELQYRLGEGPCLDAARSGGLVHADDLTRGGPWPRWAEQVTSGTPIRSALSLGIPLEPAAAVLNLYSAGTHVFTPDSVDLASLFAAHAQVLLLLVQQTDRVANLDRALTTSRLIGNAVGILMYARRLTPEEAFERLRTASSRLNRTLADIAAEVTDTGMLP